MGMAERKKFNSNLGEGSSVYVALNLTRPVLVDLSKAQGPEVVGNGKGEGLKPAETVTFKQKAANLREDREVYERDGVYRG